ncbi:MAG TPA: hypothetical protein VFF78_03425 [Anaerolineaceae bacterium]|nr:hypothetical protein [Anaerolineaceae bacterium]
MRNWRRLTVPTAWLLLFLLLPITSLPLLSSLIGSSMVAAPSIVILLFLVLFWMLPALWKGAGIPPQAKPILIFAAIALLACLLSLFFYLPAFKQTNSWINMLEGVITLGIGLCFYLTTSMWFAEEGRLRSALRWINWSGLIILAWSALQAVYSYNPAMTYPDWFLRIQEFLTPSGQLFYRRVAGMAFEPSWLAHQLNMLYLPFWLAASAKRTSAHPWRLLRKISFENLLLLGGLVILWLSSSRVGLLAFLLCLAYLFFLANVYLVNYISRRLRGKRIVSQLKRRAISAAVVLGLLAIYAGFFLGAAVALSRSDPRMKGLFDFSVISSKGILAYANKLLFAERLVFWDVGWKVFNDYPLFGVGLGNVGYYFPQKMSSFGWALVEIHDVIIKSTTIPNVKALWSRLPAETGLIGLSAFLTWLYTLWASSKHTAQQASRNLQSVGLAGQLAVVALVIEGFSLDTFALPYYWISFGLATAAWRIFRDSHLPKPKDTIKSDDKLELPVPSEGKC